ncbi:hypothetical protein ACEPAF_5828 [Sanghuangporus sanghuang]
MESMPVEILCDIFLEVVKDRNIRTHRYAPNPLYISHVCRRWRDVALSSRELWSYLEMKLEDSYGYRPMRSTQSAFWSPAVEIFDTWLLRTDSCPLNYRLIVGEVTPSNEPLYRAANHMILALLSQQHRWRNVEIRWDDKLLGVLVVNNIPLLSSLSLLLPCDYYETAFEVDISLSSELRDLRLGGFFRLNGCGDSIHRHMSSCHLVFVHHMHSLDGHMFWKLLRTAPRIEHLCAIGIVMDAAPLPNAYPLHLCDLRTLQLELHRASFFLLDKLTLPALKALKLDRSINIEAGIFLNFVRRSMPNLTCLHLQWCREDEAALLTALRFLPTLKILHLGNVDTEMRVFEALTVSDMSKDSPEHVDAKGLILCPALQCLSFENRSIRDDPSTFMHAVNTMLTSRWKLADSFTRVRFRDVDIKEDLPLIPGQQTHERVANGLQAGHSMVAESDEPPLFPQWWPPEETFS